MEKCFKNPRHVFEDKGLVESLFFSSSFFFLVFLGPHPWHMEVPRLGVKSELQLVAYATAIAMPDPSHICNLHHSSWQRRLLNPPSKAGIEPASSWILVGFVTTEPQRELLLIIYIFYLSLKSPRNDDNTTAAST